MSQSYLHLFHCITPLHTGSGQGFGAIDRPLLRESTTGYPYVQSATLKGALAARQREKLRAAGAPEGTERDDWERDDPAYRAAFGRGETDGNQGCLLFTQADLLLFPVRSLAGTFAWVTSPLVLARLARFLDLVAPGDQDLAASVRALLDAAHQPSPGVAVGGERLPDEAGQVEALDAELRLRDGGPYALEGLILKAETAASARQAVGAFAAALGKVLFADSDYWQERLLRRLLVVSSGEFDRFLASATQIEPNIRIEKSGVTQDGSLRYTELLPAETVLVSFVSLLDPASLGLEQKEADVAKLYSELAGSPIQLGGDETKGKGLVRQVLLPGGGAA